MTALEALLYTVTLRLQLYFFQRPASFDRDACWSWGSKQKEAKQCDPKAED